MYTTQKSFSKKAIIVIGFIAALSSVFLFMQKVQAIDVGLGYGDATGLGTNDPIVLTLNIIRFALGFLALIAVILILYSGFLYMTSGGNETQVEKAKRIIKNAVVGLVIILASFGIVSFIISKMLELTNANGTPTDPWDDPRNIRALGNGIVKSVYPEPEQTDVPMNTAIVVTFKEKIKPETICENVSGGFCAPNSPLKADNVRIFKSVRDSECLLPAPCSYEETATVNSTDNETFVFMPINKLGSLTKVSMKYTVFLTTDLKKIDGKDAFRHLENGFIWSFYVTNVNDLTPPQVLQYKMFPPPDNAVDQTGLISNAVQAVGSVKVKLQPTKYAEAEFLNIAPQGVTTPPAVIAIDEHCPESGVLLVTIDTDAITAKFSRKSDGISLGSTRSSGKTINFPGYFKLTLQNATDIFNAGNTWEVTVSKEVPADTLTVDNIIYSFAGTGGNFKIVPGSTVNLTAESIEKAVNGTDSYNNPHSKISATASGDTVTLKAITAGLTGNGIPLSTNNTNALGIVAMSGGKDREVSIVIKGGSSDKPRNSVIQVNFNEAINPITVSGPSADVSQAIRIVNVEGTLGDGESCTDNKECKSFKCDALKCVANVLSGKFFISNQYRTVEFLSDNECGMNSCGEKIYCLPENSHIRVELSAATLADCGTDGCASRSPYNACSAGICTDANGKNYPMAKAPMDGVIDMAINSLDGNRSTFSDGPQPQSGQPPFDENSPVPANGDDYQWSFFINDIIDISSPYIEAIKQEFNGALNEVPPDTSGINLINPFYLSFNKLMMSYSLASGYATFKDPFTNLPTTHYRINLWPHNDSFAVGYWLTKIDTDFSVPLDNYPDKTVAGLNHTKFGKDVTYRVQAGSGVKDIYQNCYNPSSRTGTSICNGAPSCCDGNPVAGSVCP